MKNKLTTAVRHIRKEIEIYRSVAADPRCPKAARWLLGGAVVYALSPIDLIPDFIPVLGHLDDLIILPFLVWMALRMIPKELIDQHRLSYETITQKTLSFHHQTRQYVAGKRKKTQNQNAQFIVVDAPKTEVNVSSSEKPKGT